MEQYAMIEHNKLLQAYAGTTDGATVEQTLALERLNRIEFHGFVLSKKIMFEERKAAATSQQPNNNF